MFWPRLSFTNKKLQIQVKSSKKYMVYTANYYCSDKKTKTRFSVNYLDIDKSSLVRSRKLCPLQDIIAVGGQNKEFAKKLAWKRYVVWSHLDNSLTCKKGILISDGLLIEALNYYLLLISASISTYYSNTASYHHRYPLYHRP